MTDINNIPKKIPYGSNVLIECPKCGFKGEPCKHREGSLLAEILSWALFLIPGVIYTSWRHINTVCKCPDCGERFLWEMDGDTNIVDNLVKIRKKQMIRFRIIVIIFPIIGFRSFIHNIKSELNKAYREFYNQTLGTINSMNNLSNAVDGVKEIYGEIDLKKPINNLTDQEKYKAWLDTVASSANSNSEQQTTQEKEISEIKDEMIVEKAKDPNDEVREKMQNILKQIDYKYGEDMRLKQESYIGASCSGDCIDGVVNIEFGENIGWYDFTVKAHQADWANTIIRAIPGYFDKLEINFICKGQTISRCIFTEYQINSYTPKGCTYYGYKE